VIVLVVSGCLSVVSDAGIGCGWVGYGGILFFVVSVWGALRFIWFSVALYSALGCMILGMRLVLNWRGGVVVVLVIAELGDLCGFSCVCDVGAGFSFRFGCERRRLSIDYAGLGSYACSSCLRWYCCLLFVVGGFFFWAWH